MTATTQTSEILNEYGLTPHPDVPDAEWATWLDHFHNPKLPLPETRVCPKCGKEMRKQNGKWGQFWGCSSYPGCKHTEKIER